MISGRTTIAPSRVNVDLSRLLTVNSFKKNLPAAVLLVLAILAFTSFWFWDDLRTSSRPLLPAATTHPATTSPSGLLDVTRADNFPGPDFSSGHPVYPYSVIPGGAVSAKELKAAMRQDPVIAAHYADFRTRFARRIRLATARQVYVSYRLGDRIYWTRKKVMLHAGEALLTDGTHLARARCGNRLSEAPAGPVSPSEPPVEIFNKPIMPDLPELTPYPLIGAPIWPHTPPSFQLTFNQPPQPGGVPFIPLLPIFPCCGASGSPSLSSNPSPSPPPQPGPPIATREPAPVLLLIVGLGGVLCLRRFFRS